MDAAPEAQLAAARALDVETRVDVAAWRDLHPNVQVQLSMDEDVGVRAMLAERATSETAIAALAEDSESQVRAAVAANDHTPPEPLAILARDPSRHVRSAVLWSANVTAEQVSHLAEDRSVQVRWNVIQSHPQRLDLMELLAGDSDEMNAHHAAMALKHRWRNPARH